MKTKIVLEIETKMNKKMIKKVTKDSEEENKITREEVEESIHDGISRVIDDDRIVNAVSEIIDEGGWIEDFEDYRFPEDYCKIKFKVKK